MDIHPEFVGGVTHQAGDVYYVLRHVDILLHRSHVDPGIVWVHGVQNLVQSEKSVSRKSIGRRIDPTIQNTNEDKYLSLGLYQHKLIKAYKNIK